MAKIQCPGCGMIEDVDLQGRFLARCSSCHQEFVVYVIGQRIMDGVDVICPECGSYHNSTLLELNNMRVTCNSCGHSFVWKG